jgi:hypothetical protein
MPSSFPPSTAKTESPEQMDFISGAGGQGGGMVRDRSPSSETRLGIEGK